MAQISPRPDPRENKMGVMPVGKLLRNMAAPMIVSMLVQALYNIVDSVYVAQVSQDAVTALSLAFPIQNLQIGFATGIGVGVNALLSKSLGEGNRERANRAAGNGFFLLVICVAAFMLFGAFGTELYFSTLDTTSQVRAMGSDYTAICCIFTLGVFVSVLCERLLQATGRTVHSMIVQGAGAVTNILLDPCFIFGWGFFPKLGVAGAAVATVIGQTVGAVLGLILNWKCNRDVELRVKNLVPQKQVIAPVLGVGVPSIVMVAIGSVMNYGMNQILLGFPEVGNGASAIFGIYFKVQSLFFMPLFGLNNATISIVAFNYGARKRQRITKTLRLAVITAMCFCCLGLLAFELLPKVLLGIFNMDGRILKLGCTALRIIGIHFPLAAVGISLGASFQALGNGIYSTITSLCRQMLALLPAAYVLSLSGNVDLVWWAFPIAEVVSLLATLYFFARIYRQKIKNL